MMKYFLYLLVAFVQISAAENGPTINSILITGNLSTEEEVIERELLFKVGDILNDSLLNVSRNRLENLFLFNRVEIFQVPENESVTLLIDVTERLYIFPYPQLQIEDRDWDKFTYGFGFAHANFRGKNEKLYGEANFGYKPGFKFGFFNPWIGKKLHLTTGIYFRKYISSHKTMAFDEHHVGFNFVFGKYWTRYFYNTLYLSFDRIDVPKDYAAFMQSGSTRDIIPSILFHTGWDKRDLYAYPSKGFYYQLVLAKHGLSRNYVNYEQVHTELRQYFSFAGITLASRFHSTTSFGELPFYRKVYFGFMERIRGHFHDIYEGKHRIVSSAELRIPLVKVRYFDLPSALIPQSATQNLKFGINAAFFADGGIVWEKKHQLGMNNAITGFGTALHVLLPYVEVARLELAFDTEFKSQVIFEVRSTF